MTASGLTNRSNSIDGLLWIDAGVYRLVAKCSLLRFWEFGSYGLEGLLIGKPGVTSAGKPNVDIDDYVHTYLAALHTLGSSRCPLAGAILIVRK